MIIKLDLNVITALPVSSTSIPRSTAIKNDLQRLKSLIESFENYDIIVESLNYSAKC